MFSDPAYKTLTDLPYRGTGLDDEIDYSISVFYGVAGAAAGASQSSCGGNDRGPSPQHPGRGRGSGDRAGGFRRRAVAKLESPHVFFCAARPQQRGPLKKTSPSKSGRVEFSWITLIGARIKFVGIWINMTGIFLN